jgi:hypothetical protein
MYHLKLKMSRVWYDHFVLAAPVTLHPKVIRNLPWTLSTTVQWDGSPEKIQKVRDWFLDKGISAEKVKIWHD